VTAAEHEAARYVPREIAEIQSPGWKPFRYPPE
jgi:hypothetical protein